VTGVQLAHSADVGPVQVTHDGSQVEQTTSVVVMQAALSKVPSSQVVQSKHALWPA
jgi:hypothetical protein